MRWKELNILNTFRAQLSLGVCETQLGSLFDEKKGFQVHFSWLQAKLTKTLKSTRLKRQNITLNKNRIIHPDQVDKKNDRFCVNNMCVICHLSIYHLSSKSTPQITTIDNES